MGSLMAQLVKNPPAMQETLVQFLDQEDPLEKGQATYSSIRRLSLVAQLVKNLPAMQETWVRSLGQEDPLEKRKATQYFSLENYMDYKVNPWGHKELDMTE